MRPSLPNVIVSNLYLHLLTCASLHPVHLMTYYIILLRHSQPTCANEQACICDCTYVHTSTYVYTNGYTSVNACEISLYCCYSLPFVALQLLCIVGIIVTVILIAGVCFVFAFIIRLFLLARYESFRLLAE